MCSTAPRHAKPCLGKILDLNAETHIICHASGPTPEQQRQPDRKMTRKPLNVVNFHVNVANESRDTVRDSNDPVSYRICDRGFLRYRRAHGENSTVRFEPQYEMDQQIAATRYTEQLSEWNTQH